MKITEQVYASLTPIQRFQTVMDAFDRLDLQEIDRLHDTAPMRNCRIHEPDYFGRIKHVHMLAAHLMLWARAIQARTLAAIAVLTACTTGLDRPDLSQSARSSLETRSDEYAQICSDGIASLKSLDLAWKEFCAQIGIAPSSISRLWGDPLLGSLGCFESIFQEVVPQIERDENYYQETFHFLEDAWRRHVEERDLRLGSLRR